MKGYPKHFNTKQDFINVLETMPEHREKLCAYLTEIKDLDDSKIITTTTLKSNILFTVKYSKVEEALEIGEINQFLEKEIEKALKQSVPELNVTKTSDTTWSLSLGAIPALHLEKVDDGLTASLADAPEEWNTKEIQNPLPLYKQKGFKNRGEIQSLIAQYGGSP